MTTPQATKIVIVSGQEFSVPSETDNEAIRTQLAGMGFADVAAATITKGTREIGGLTIETIEFVKKAGTKGLDPAGLAALLAEVPPSTLPAVRRYGPSDAQAAQLAELADAELTFEQALTLDGLEAALDSCCEQPPSPSLKGATLCRTLDQLIAVAASAPVAW